MYHMILIGIRCIFLIVINLEICSICRISDVELKISGIRCLIEISNNRVFHCLLSE